MSDLQCAATVLVVRPCSAADLDALVAWHHVAAVYQRSGDLRSQVGSLADLHRGETVVVVTADGAQWLPSAPVVEVRVDSDAWTVRALPATTVIEGG